MRGTDDMKRTVNNSSLPKVEQRGKIRRGICTAVRDYLPRDKLEKLCRLDIDTDIKYLYSVFYLV